jgi:hypothetical protein
MNSIASWNATLQAIAALLIFVAAYLAFVLFVIGCLVTAELISEHECVVRDYGVTRNSRRHQHQHHHQRIEVHHG